MATNPSSGSRRGIMSNRHEQEAANLRERAEAAERQLLQRALDDAEAQAAALNAAQAEQTKKEQEQKDAALAEEIEKTRRASCMRYQTSMLSNSPTSNFASG